MSSQRCCTRILRAGNSSCSNNHHQTLLQSSSIMTSVFGRRLVLSSSSLSSLSTTTPYTRSTTSLFQPMLPLLQQQLRRSAVMMSSDVNLHSKIRQVLGTTMRSFASLPSHEVVGLPSLSPTMESGSIAAWNVKAGDSVIAGDVFASIETDKAVVDFEAQDDGIVAQILVPAGTEVKVNTPVMILVSDMNDVKAFENYTLDDSTTTGSTGTATPTAAAAATLVPDVVTPTAPVVATTSTPSTVSAVRGSGDTIFASPLARKLAQEKGYDIASIPGTGPNGRIIAADVKEYQPAAVVVATATTTMAAPVTTAVPSPPVITSSITPVAGSGYMDYPIPVSVSDVAARLAQSKRNVPHYYLTVDINADALIQLRHTVNQQLLAGKKKDTTVDQNDTTTIGMYEFMIKAAGLSMRTIPSANASWMESHVRVYDSVDVNIVRGAGESLNILTIRNITGIGIKSIMTTLHQKNVIDDEASTMIDNGLGTFTMMNVGMYGVKACAPIIREPQACAIAIGTLQPRIIPTTSMIESEKGGFQQSVMFTVTASFDHRVVDGAVGAQWLAAFKSYIENPSTLLL